MLAASAQVADAWGADVEVVIAGLTNTYSSYITTWEEYQARMFWNSAEALPIVAVDVTILLCLEYRVLGKHTLHARGVNYQQQHIPSAQVQRYEGASTLYGPHTLGAYIQEFRR